MYSFAYYYMSGKQCQTRHATMYRLWTGTHRRDVLQMHRLWRGTTAAGRRARVRAMTARIYYPELVVRTDHWPEISRARQAGRVVQEVDEDERDDTATEHTAPEGVAQ